MSAFTGFAASFCTVCVLAGGLYLLCPSNRLEASVKYVFGLVFLLCVITAVPRIKSFAPDINIKAQAVSVSLNAAAGRWVFEEALRREKIDFSKITLCTDKNSSGGIIINKVIVYSDAPAEKIREIIGGDGAEYAVEVVSE